MMVSCYLTADIGHTLGHMVVVEEEESIEDTVHHMGCKGSKVEGMEDMGCNGGIGEGTEDGMVAVHCYSYYSFGLAGSL